MIERVEGLGSLGDLDIDVGDFNFGFAPSGGISNYANFDPSKYISDFMKSPQARMIKPSKRADSAKNSGDSDLNGESSQTSGPGTYIGTGITGIEVGDKDGIMEVVATAMRENPNITQEQLAQLVNSYQNNPSSFGQSPTAPTPFEQEETTQEETQQPGQPAQTGPMGGKAVPFIKKFITKLLELHPATATPMLLMQIGKGLYNSKDVAGDMKKVFTQFGMNKLMGNVGISSLGRQALGSIQNVNRGQQTGGQAIGSLMTNAAFRKGFPSLAKKAYQKGGEPAVYGLLSLASMGMENLNKNYFRTPPSGPPGDG